MRQNTPVLMKCVKQKKFQIHTRLDESSFFEIELL